MLIGSFVAGSVPLAFKLSESRLRYLSALSVGLLMGTALLIIIPEGVETLYSAQELHSALPITEEHETSAHQYIGLALVLGFAIMFLIDQISSLHIHGSNSNDHSAGSAPIEFTELNLMLEAHGEQNPNTTNENLQNKNNHTRRETSTSRFRHASPKGPSQMTPTVGLVVHAAADGIALGASARHPHLSFVIFFAIMIHKAPSAFALTTVLMNEGFMRARIRRHLFVFSLAAPVGAILTYAALLFSGDPDDQGMAWWTGMLLIFSGGTFLYVAMHVMEEVKNYTSKKNTNFRANDHSEKMSRSEVACVLIGMFIPAILNIEHGH
ncbi:Zinc/iron permease [Umbelopsis sp. PMI_123]|nr:Zinc/iron permease [Umbelopsis sp. PMI_123]